MIMSKSKLAIAVGALMLVSSPLTANDLPELDFFGRVSLNLYHLDAEDQHSTSVVDDKSLNSRLGASFQQNLGNGLVGFGKTEWNFQPSDAESFAQQRDTFVGIRGGWGQVALGTFHGAYKITGGVLWDPMITTPIESRRQAGMAGGAYGHNAFMRRMVEYRTPSLNGFRGILQYGFDRRDTSTPGSYGDVNLSVQYVTGDWDFIGAYVNADSEESGENTNWKIGAKWSPGSWTLAAQYEEVEIRKGGHRIDFANVLKGSDGSRPTTALNFITAGQEAAGDAGLNTDTSHLFLRASRRYGVHEFHGILGHMDASDLGKRDITAYTLGYTRWFSPTFRFLGGIQFQDRGSDWDSGDLTIVTAGLRYDFAASIGGGR